MYGPMISRQIALGLTGGMILALVALFLTTPREIVEGAFAEWVPAPATELPAGLPRIDSDPPLVSAMTPAGPAQTSAASPPLAVLEGGPVGLDPFVAADEALLADDTGDEYEASPEHLHPDALLGALAKQTVVRAEPDQKAPVLGYVRTGTLLRRALVPQSKHGCKEGWYRVEPRGYVCVGDGATLDLDHPVLGLTGAAPDRSSGMPYPYGKSRQPAPPLYGRIPTREEQLSAEPDLEAHLAKNFGSVWASDASSDPPSLLREGASIPRPLGYPELGREAFLGHALSSSTFSFIDLFVAGGRRFGLTADLALVPLDRVTKVPVSDFSGLRLSEGAGLPVAFVMRAGEQLYGGDPVATELKALRPIQRREGFVLSGRHIEYGGGVFLETRGGDYLRLHPELVRIERLAKRPKWAKDGRTWIDVSINQQTLVAYEGERPVFATLISTGRDGLGDPETTRSTVQGLYLIHTKHVTATMSGNEADDEYDLRDVPYVQYFHGGYAFHAAYWHDNFGRPRSHGCINLSPADARTLFGWSDPPVPQRWHSALSREGTLVYIHP